VKVNNLNEIKNNIYLAALFIKQSNSTSYEFSQTIALNKSNAGYEPKFSVLPSDVFKYQLADGTITNIDKDITELINSSNKPKLLTADIRIFIYEYNKLNDDDRIGIECNILSL